jgi:RNA polymerase sigma-70 factor (ECF subfamily)
MNGDILVEQTLAGDKQVFNSLITDYYADVYGMILSWVKNPEDAKDLTQDVFISVYLDLPSLRDHEQFYSWLKQIARHKCQNWKRKQIDFVPLHDDLISEEPSTDEVLILRETLAKVMEVIDNLPESEKRLLKEHYLDDVSYDELEARHGVSTKALVVRLVRARRKIRDQLEKTLSALAAFLHDHTESILTGGMEIMKLSVKTKLIAGGIVLLFILAGTGILVNKYYTQNESRQGVSQTLQESHSKLPVKSISGESKSLIKDNDPIDKNVVTQVKSQINEQKADIADASNKTEESKINNSKEEKQNQELIKKAKEYSDLAGILPKIIKASIRTVQLINEQSKHNTSVTIKQGEEPPVDEEGLKLVKKIEDGIREETKYYKQIGSMFPDLKLYTEWYDPTEGALDQMNYRFDGNRLLEYFGKDLPWDGNIGYSQAKEWDGKTNWRDLMDSYKKQIQ